MEKGEAVPNRRPIAAYLHSSLIVAGLAGFMALGFLLENDRSLDGARAALRTVTVPSRLLSRGKLGVLARKMHLFDIVPSDLSSLELSSIPDLPLEAGPFQKKRKPSAFLLQARAAPGADLNELRPFLHDNGLPPEDFRPGRAVVVLRVPDADLHNPKTGILSNWKQKGTEWEREARVTFYDETGRKRLDTGVGLRLHGGKSRMPGNLHSYRLHFKKAYGTDRFPEGLLFSHEAEPVRQIVLWNDWPVSLPFNTALAFDVARQIGCLTPELHPALLIFNGKREGLYYLLQRPRRREWVSRFGHTNFVMHAQKRTLDPQGLALHEELVCWARNVDKTMTLKDAERYVDTDYLSRWIFNMIYCGATDAYQGPGIMDLSEARPRWRWLVWDIDHAFARIYPRHSLTHIWEKDNWNLALRLPGGAGYNFVTLSRWDARGVIFSRLMNESPEYRENFIKLAMDLLNHRITEAFAAERVAHYRKMAEVYEFTDTAFLDDYQRFFKFRHFHLREMLRRHLGLGPTLRCRVSAPPGARLLVDGYPAPQQYQGWYLPGRQITVAAPDAKNQAWQVNNGKPNAGPLSLTVTEPLEIIWTEVNPARAKAPAP